MFGVAIGIGAWGLVSGVAMANSGMGVSLAVLMSLTVFAGSAQLATMPLIAAGAPLWVVWGTALCVNLRFVIFSANWRPYLMHLPRGQRLWVAYFTADMNTVMFMKRFPQPVVKPEQWPYFWGMSLTNWAAWQGASLVGILLASSIPADWGLAFAGTLALFGLICSLLVTRSTWVSAAVAACAAVAAYALPFKLNIVVSIAAAVSAGLLLDRGLHWHRGRRA
jgi:predicted branched-subunit amino acid permease